MSDSLKFTFDHVHMFCSDLAATERWYVERLGAELLDHRRIDGLPAAEVRIAGVSFLLSTAREDAQVPEKAHLATEHVGFRVENLAAAAEELKRRGVEFDVEPFQVRPGLSIAFIKGPDNLRIELAQRG